MNFNRVRIRNFRNYKSLDLEIPDGVLIFHGENAQGKTNFIESLYLLLRGHSFRPSDQSVFLNSSLEDSQSGLLIKASIHKEELTHDLSLAMNGGKKNFQWNNKKSSPLKISEQFPLVLFSPESLSAIKDGPEARRMLLDDLLELEGRSSIQVLRDFRKTLRSRNKVLRDCKAGLIEKDTANRILDSLDGSYLPIATEVAQKRIEWLKNLEPQIGQSFASISHKKNVHISVEYVISGHSALDWSRAEILSAMHQRSIQLRPAELESGRTLIGPQKHDINFYIEGKNARFYGSQGQQRTLVLAFKMAQIMVHYQRYKVYPFLFLDDVLSELDAQKRDRLVEFLRGIPSQIFLTTTEVSFAEQFGERQLSVFEVNGGQIVK